MSKELMKVKLCNYLIREHKVVPYQVLHVSYSNHRLKFYANSREREQ